MSGMIEELIAVARRHQTRDELDLAELRLREALARMEAEKGSNDESLIWVLEWLAGLYWQRNRNDEARDLANRAMEIRASILRRV